MWHSTIGPTISQINQNKHSHGNQLLDQLLVKLGISYIHMATNCWTIC